MQTWSKISAATQHFCLLLFDGFSNHCLANLIEPLRAANMLSGRVLYSWEFVTLEGAPATSSSGMQVTPNRQLKEASGDMLMIMPSYDFRKFSGGQTNLSLRSSMDRFDTLVGLDTGSWLLAEAGLLDGYSATIHWEELVTFSEAFPDVDAKRERFVINGNRITCGGAMAAFDLVKFLIGRDQGQGLALEVAQLFMFNDANTIGSSQIGRGRSLINRAIALMQEHIEEPLLISEIARRVGCTQRMLEVRIQSAMGAPPQKIYRRTRLIVARKLISETNMAISEVSLRCGYLNSSAMTRAFRAEFGATPRELRADLS